VVSAEVDAVPRTSAGRIAGGIGLAAVGAVAANTLISLLARAAGASGEFQPLRPSAYVFLTVVGVLAGAGGWAAVRRWSGRPATVLRWLVPVVVGLSLLPDIALLFTDAQPNTSGLGVAGLMAMHLATAAVAVALFRRVLPLPAR
jgi:hypothetical protein